MRYFRLVPILSVAALVFLSACGSSNNDKVEKVDSGQLQASANICNIPKTAAKPGSKCSSASTKMMLQLAVPAGWQPYKFGAADQDGVKHMLSQEVKENCRLLVSISLRPTGNPNPITAKAIKRSVDHGLVIGGGNWVLTPMGSSWMFMQAGPAQKDSQHKWYPIWNISTYAIQNAEGEMDPQTPDCVTNQSAWGKQVIMQLASQVKLGRS